MFHTSPASRRKDGYAIAAEVRADPELAGVKLIALSGYGLQITERVPLQVPADEHNEGYLRTKRDKLGHELELPGPGKPASKPESEAKKPPSGPEGGRE